MNLDRYGYWLDASGIAPKSVALFRGYARRYLDRLQATDTDPIRCTVSDVAGFLSNPVWAPATRANARSALISFHEWLMVEGLREDNPVKGVKRTKVPPGPPKLCSEDAFDTGLAAARAAGDERGVLVLLLAGYAGLRRNEIATLHADHITERGLRVTGKGGKTRMVPVHPVLSDYLEGVKARGDWFFPSPHTYGDHVHPRTINRVVNDYLPAGMSTHSLRHRFATMVHYGSKDLRAVQELLGHSSLATTQRYVSVNWDDLTLAVGSLTTFDREVLV